MEGRFLFCLEPEEGGGSQDAGEGVGSLVHLRRNRQPIGQRMSDLISTTPIGQEREQGGAQELGMLFPVAGEAQGGAQDRNGNGRGSRERGSALHTIG